MNLFGNVLFFIVENKNRTIFDNQFFFLKKTIGLELKHHWLLFYKLFN